MNNAYGDQSSVIKLLWGLRQPPRRGPKPTLSAERIARVAMEIADTDGLAAVSMQRVASELEFTKMALYRYVSGKSELLAVMIELAVADPPDLAGVPGGWRGRIEEFARQLSVVWQRHPWLPWATLGDRVMGPRELGWIESAVSCLTDTGLTGTEQLTRSSSSSATSATPSRCPRQEPNPGTPTKKSHRSCKNSSQSTATATQP